MAIYCGNNQLDRKLKTIRFGTHAECFKKGYGLGYNSPIHDDASFIAEWNGKYKPHIIQKLMYSDAELPPRFQRATLNQSLARGYAFGCVARAKKTSEPKTFAETPRT